MGSASASSKSILELAGIVSAGLLGSFWQLLTKDTPVAPHYQKLAMQIQYRENTEQLNRSVVYKVACAMFTDSSENTHVLKRKFCL